MTRLRTSHTSRCSVRFRNNLIVRNDLGVESISDLIEMARSRSGELNIGTAGEGSMGHLASELLMMSADVAMVRIPYGGTADAHSRSPIGRS